MRIVTGNAACCSLPEAGAAAERLYNETGLAETSVLVAGIQEELGVGTRSVAYEEAAVARVVEFTIWTRDPYGGLQMALGADGYRITTRNSGDCLLYTSDAADE